MDKSFVQCYTDTEEAVLKFTNAMVDEKIKTVTWNLNNGFRITFTNEAK